jgi:protein involved in ribonucleotide reduction
MIAYASRTGNVRHIALQIGLPCVEIREDTTLDEPFLLLTYTDGLGQVPPVVERFMARCGAYCRGVAASGNRNFGRANFARAGDAVAERWNVPLVRKLELRGFPRDYEAIRQFYFERIGEVSRHGVLAAAQ